MGKCQVNVPLGYLYFFSFLVLNDNDLVYISDHQSLVQYEGKLTNIKADIGIIATGSLLKVFLPFLQFNLPLNCSLIQW